MTIRMPSVLLAAFCVASTGAWSQEASVAGKVERGHKWANMICAFCHVASSDQDIPPILRPPAPSFESIAQREAISAEWIQTFLATTHRDVGANNGMPNPMLLDSQMAEVAAYIMSLRKPAGRP
jgi:cytochrome c553